MSRWLIAFSVALAVCVGLPASSEAGITVDGQLNDWGISIQPSQFGGHHHTIYDGYNGVCTF